VLAPKRGLALAVRTGRDCTVVTRVSFVNRRHADSLQPQDSIG
jgi:hypothetical protein